jgi:hypothetical protein
MGLLGIVLGLLLLLALAFRGWSVLLLAPAPALVAALFAGEPLLAHWTQTFMGGTAHFLAQFFPLFLLGDMTRRLGERRAILAVVLDVVDRSTFEAVQAKLAENVRARRVRVSNSLAILMGRIFDDRGNRMTPSRSNKGGVRYRY